MDLSLSEEQQQITDSAANFLAEAATMPVVRAVSESADGLDRSLWRGIAELGWCGVHLPETARGLGLGMVELVLLQEQLGRRLACVPFFDSAVLAATVLRELPESTVAQDWLQQLAAGQAIGALALPSCPASGHATAQVSATGWVLHGDWPLVGSAAMADVLLLSAQTASGESLLFAVPADTKGLQVQPLVMLDATRRMAAVCAQAVDLPASGCISQGPFLDEILMRIHHLGAIALAAEQVGVAQQCLDLTLAYAAQRS